MGRKKKMVSLLATSLQQSWEQCILPLLSFFFLSPRAAGVCCLSLVSLQGKFFLCSWLLQPPLHCVCGEMGILSCIWVELEEVMAYPKYVLQEAIPLAMKYSFVAAKHSSCPWSSLLLTKGWMLTLHKKEGQVSHLPLSAIPNNAAGCFTPMCILSSVLLLWFSSGGYSHSWGTPGISWVLFPRVECNSSYRSDQRFSCSSVKGI